MPKGKILMGKKTPKPTPDPYFLDIFPPAEGFGGYGPNNPLAPPQAPAIKKVPKRVSVTRRGGK